MRYALITPARNEAKTLPLTIESVAKQTILPVKWVIVDDGSTDDTSRIVDLSKARYPWIHLVRNPPRQTRSFAGKARAVNGASCLVAGDDADLICNLDADVTFDPDYFEFLISRFENSPKLGIAGTPFTQDGYDSARDSFEGENYVAGPCQVFRFACFRDIGGYVENDAGGVDWIAVMTARMRGWEVRSFPERRYHHHRAMGTAERGQLEALYSYGKKDYYLGGSPLWELFRVAYRCVKRPYVLGGAALLLGYSAAAITRMKRPVSDELMRFHRRDQMMKLRSVLRSLVRLKKIDSFSAPKEPTR